jgi:uncharacterized protein
MSNKEYHLHSGKKGAALAVRITPKASQNEIVEILADGTIKIRLMAAAGDGKTNEALVNYLADVLEIPPSKVEIIAGENGVDKLVSVLDIDADMVHQRILRRLS